PQLKQINSFIEFCVVFAEEGHRKSEYSGFETVVQTTIEPATDVGAVSVEIAACKHAHRVEHKHVAVWINRLRENRIGKAGVLKFGTGSCNCIRNDVMRNQ